MKPICVPCQRFYKMETMGICFIEAMPTVIGALPGKGHADDWKPYKLWMGDMWKCQGCGAEIVVGVGQIRIAEHYEKDFAQKIESFNAKLQINDC